MFTREAIDLLLTLPMTRNQSGIQASTMTPHEIPTQTGHGGTTLAHLGKGIVERHSVEVLIVFYRLFISLAPDLAVQCRVWSGDSLP